MHQKKNVFGVYFQFLVFISNLFAFVSDILHVVRNNMKISCINLSACRVDATFAHLIADYIRVIIIKINICSDSQRFVTSTLPTS